MPAIELPPSKGILNHKLIGQRVVWNLLRVRVTGAKKMKNGKVKFRVLLLGDKNPMKEIWTPASPVFDFEEGSYHATH